MPGKQRAKPYNGTSKKVGEPCPFCGGTGLVKASPATRFRQARDTRNVTQAEMAGLVGITRVQWTNIENGRSEPSLALMMRTADLCGVTVDWLLGRS